MEQITTYNNMISRKSRINDGTEFELVFSHRYVTEKRKIGDPCDMTIEIIDEDRDEYHFDILLTENWEMSDASKAMKEAANMCGTMPVSIKITLDGKPKTSMQKQ